MSSQTSPSTPTASGAGARLLSLTGLDAGHFAVLARHPDDMTRKTGMLNPFRTALLLVEKDAAKIEQLVPNMNKAPSDVGCAIQRQCAPVTEGRNKWRSRSTPGSVCTLPPV
ncbi:hypothetical protein A1Q2_00992 [Trichosporon asahii var. asahii CBS 8904]|uniref:Uncharacterized protein n=1 Tax=Trichosporon asahii var. asahii (strain CBS 8904) TaxID=1220162 RepID=K1VYY2_TRIAC|nr:hypothetical protein A1Q2_00992 [Trichosporon asahii var. asahii CBS 8904]